MFCRIELASESKHEMSKPFSQESFFSRTNVGRQRKTKTENSFGGIVAQHTWITSQHVANSKDLHTSLHLLVLPITFSDTTLPATETFDCPFTRKIVSLEIKVQSVDSRQRSILAWVPIASHKHEWCNHECSAVLLMVKHTSIHSRVLAFFPADESRRKVSDFVLSAHKPHGSSVLPSKRCKTVRQQKSTSVEHTPVSAVWEFVENFAHKLQVKKQWSPWNRSCCHQPVLRTPSPPPPAANKNGALNTSASQAKRRLRQ